MTATEEHTGLHKKWLERKLEIEVGKVQAKLLSKGLSVPVPDPEAVEVSLRQSQAHLPKFYLELYGRNSNGTLRAQPDQAPGSGAQQPPTLAQKLERLLDPALLAPLPDDISAIHGLPSCSSTGLLGPEPTGTGTGAWAASPDGRPGGGPEGGLSSTGGPTGRPPALHLPLHSLNGGMSPGTGSGAGSAGRNAGTASVGGGGGGGGGGGQNSTAAGGTIPGGGTGTSSGGAIHLHPHHHYHHHLHPNQHPTLHSYGSYGAGGMDATAATTASEGGGGGGLPRTSRSPPPNLNWRPDLQGADARIDDAMELVQRVALQANEMSPRERVLYLAKQANPNFSLPHPRNAHALASHGSDRSRSRRELLRRNSRRASFRADLSGGGSGGAGQSGGGGGAAVGSVSMRYSRLGSMQGVAAGQPGGDHAAGAVSAARRSHVTAVTADGRRRNVDDLHSGGGGGSGSGRPTSGGTGGGSGAHDGALPPLGSRSRSLGRLGSHSGATFADGDGLTGRTPGGSSTVSFKEDVEVGTLPALGAVSPSSPSPTRLSARKSFGEVDGGLRTHGSVGTGARVVAGPLPPLPATTATKPATMVTLWGVAAAAKAEGDAAAAAAAAAAATASAAELEAPDLEEGREQDQEEGGLLDFEIGEGEALGAGTGTAFGTAAAAAAVPVGASADSPASSGGLAPAHHSPRHGSSVGAAGSEAAGGTEGGGPGAALPFVAAPYGSLTQRSSVSGGSGSGARGHDGGPGAHSVSSGSQRGTPPGGARPAAAVTGGNNWTP